MISIQVAQLSQRNRAAGCVTFRWVMGDGVGQTILCIKRCLCQKTKSNDLLQINICDAVYQNQAYVARHR